MDFSDCFNPCIKNSGGCHETKGSQATRPKVLTLMPGDRDGELQFDKDLSSSTGYFQMRTFGT